MQLQVQMEKKGQMMKVHQKAFGDGWDGPKGSFWLIFCYCALRIKSAASSSTTKS
jgi:hypothetical protein